MLGRVHPSELRSYSVPGAGQDLPADVLAFIRRGYELWNDGELEAVAGMWSEDIVWQNDPDWPGQTRYRGRDEVVAFLRDEVAAVIELGDIEVESIRAFGDELVIKLLARTRGADSHLDIGKVPIFHVAQVRDGQVARIRAFLDEERALAAASEPAA
jgi:ketosteroid isomerase-like protein